MTCTINVNYVVDLFLMTSGTLLRVGCYCELVR